MPMCCGVANEGGKWWLVVVLVLMMGIVLLGSGGSRGLVECHGFGTHILLESVF